MCIVIFCHKIFLLFSLRHILDEERTVLRKNIVLGNVYREISDLLRSQSIGKRKLLFLPIGRLPIMGKPFAIGNFHIGKDRPKGGILRAARIDTE